MHQYATGRCALEEMLHNFNLSSLIELKADEIKLRQNARYVEYNCIASSYHREDLFRTPFTLWRVTTVDFFFFEGWSPQVVLCGR